MSHMLVLAQPAHNIGPLSARQRNAIQMAFRLRADGGPLLDVFVKIVLLLRVVAKAFAARFHELMMRLKAMTKV